MEAHQKQPEENQESAKDIKPFRAASIMVNKRMQPHVPTLRHTVALHKQG